MVLSTVIYFVTIFLLLLIFIIIGAKIVDKFRTIAVILMLCIGIIIPYLIAFLISSIFENFEYRWFHFLGLFLLIGLMNNANIRGEASKQAQLTSTFLFFGAIIMSILMFWIT
jgi:hypothetical protein